MGKESSQGWYSKERFLKELSEVSENPTTSGLTSQFNRYVTKVRFGAWGLDEKLIAESLIRVGLSEDYIDAIPDFLEIVRTEPLSLNLSFVGFMTKLRKKTFSKEVFNQDDLLLISKLLLVGMPKEVASEIENEQSIR